MWNPKTEEDIRKAVGSGAIEESPIFDAKKELPKKNQEIAKDVAAMANDGGVLIYGIAEDAEGRPTILNPISLVNEPERIDSVVRTSIAEPPSIIISTIPTSVDPSKGYIVVHVPPSERAPHMVVVKGENRYYGRSAKANMPLTEGEVARLYERRQRLAVDRDALLNEEVLRAPLKPNPNFAYLHLLARPVMINEDMLNQVCRTGSPVNSILNVIIQSALEKDILKGTYSPYLRPQMNWIQRADGFIASYSNNIPTASDDPKSALTLQINFDGSGHLFCGRAGDTTGDTHRNILYFLPATVAGLVMSFISFLGGFYERANYIGMVDFGLALTGLKGSIPYTRYYVNEPYDCNEYRKTMRVSALILIDDNVNITRSLLMPLLNAMSQGRIDPFDIPQR